MRGSTCCWVGRSLRRSGRGKLRRRKGGKDLTPPDWSSRRDLSVCTCIGAGLGRGVRKQSRRRDGRARAVGGGGVASGRVGLRGMGAAAESVCVARDVQLAEMTGARLHVAHLSAKASLEQVRWAKSRGLKVSCEVTPHHFTLIDEDLQYDAKFKMNPPLAAREDREALLAGLAEGTGDALGAGRAPHSA